MPRSLPNIAAAVVIPIAVVLLGARLSGGASPALAEPAAAPMLDATPMSAGEDTAVFAGGCFWGVEAVYDHVKGVNRAISGYAGGNEVNLAMERGEVGARGCQAWSSWASTKPEWLAEHKIHVLVQVARKKSPELPDVPLLMDLAKNEKDRQVLRFMSMDNSYGRPFATTPDVPKDRVAALRRAFDQSMRDPDLLAEAAKSDLRLTPSSGEEVQRLVAEVIATPPEIVERTKVILDEAARLERVR